MLRLYSIGKWMRIAASAFVSICGCTCRLSGQNEADARQKCLNAGLSVQRCAELFGASKSNATSAQVRPPGSMGQAWLNPKDKLLYRYVPQGKFVMGCSTGDRLCYPSEIPGRVELVDRGFWMGQTEVTIEAFSHYAEVVGRNMPPQIAMEKLPVTFIRWSEARDFCVWGGGRLPTDKEWEFAARGRTASATYDELTLIAWFGNNSGRKLLDAQQLWSEFGAVGSYRGRLVENGASIHTVGEKKPNAYGMFDMLGNVWEWTADACESDNLGSCNSRNSIASTKADFKVVRGGDVFSPRSVVRVSTRFAVAPDSAAANIGFRCVLDK
jgi:formylglycine-generating enzyme